MSNAELIRDLVVSKLRERTLRDKQRRVGASNLSNGCDFHLASAMKGVNWKPSYVEYGDDERAWLGAVIGTGIHGILEGRMQDDDDLVSEKTILVGTIPGYGEVWSTPDLYIRSLMELVDFKSTTRKKTATFRAALGLKSKVTSQAAIDGAAHRLEEYADQTSVYAGGLIRAGLPVEGITIAFVNRDGTGWFDSVEWDDYKDPDNNRDIWTHSFPYDSEREQRVWDRAARIWAQIESGAPMTSFERSQHCYTCQTSGAELANAVDKVQFNIPWEDA